MLYDEIVFAAKREQGENLMRAESHLAGVSGWEEEMHTEKNDEHDEGAKGRWPKGISVIRPG